MNKKLLAAALLLLPFSNATGQSVPTIMADVSPGSSSSRPTGLTVFNNALYFSTNALGLWTFDGTNAAAVTAANALNCGYQMYRYAAANGKLYCNCNGQYYSYTGSGTPTIVTDATGNANSNDVSIGNKVYYWGSDGTTNGLCYMDATTGAATNVFDRLTLGIGSLLWDMVVYNNKVYFVGDGGSESYMLYCYDPASGNTDLVTTNAGFKGSNPQSFHVGDDNKLYFSLVDSVDNRELFVIDGNNPPLKLTSLYSTNAGVYGRNQLAGNNNYRNIVKFGNAIYFPGNNGTAGYELMKYDLTSHATSLIKDINTGTNSSYPEYLTVYNNKLYFNATTAAEGQELWVSDGTAAGTSLVYDLNPAAGNGNPSLFTQYGGKLYFQAQDASSGYELFRLSATAGIESVARAKDIAVYPNPASANVTISLSLVNAENLTVTLTDATGKTVYTSPLQQCVAGANILNVPTQHLSTAVYQYRIANDKNELIGAGSITRR